MMKKRMMIVTAVLALTLGLFVSCGGSDSVAGSYDCVMVEQVSQMTIDQTDAVASMCSLELKSSGDAVMVLQGITTEGTWTEDGDTVLINDGEYTLSKDSDGDLSLTVNEDLFTYNYRFEK